LGYLKPRGARARAAKVGERYNESQHTCVYMPSRTVNLSEEAYQRLAALKVGGESFSDVVNRLTGKHAVLQLRGVLSDAQARAFREVVRDSDRRYRAESGRVARRLQRGRARHRRRD
jgi:predicted CopG family antitoxin